MTKKKTLRKDLCDAAANQRYVDATGHAWGVPRGQLEREWRESVREWASDVAERAHELRLSGLDPYEPSSGLEQYTEEEEEDVDYIEARRRQEHAASILQAKAVLIAAEHDGDWSALPEWILKKWERRRAGGALEALDVDVEVYIATEALEDYQRAHQAREDGS